MTDYTPKLVEALLSGGSVDEIVRQEMDRSVNTLLETEITASLGYEMYPWGRVQLRGFPEWELYQDDSQPLWGYPGQDSQGSQRSIQASDRPGL